MIKRRLGRTGFEVSALGLGGFQFTGMFGVSMQEADNIIDYAIAHDVNLIDTAQCYGNGESEAIIGRALLRHPNDAPIVCAKVGHFEDGILAGLKDKVPSARRNYDEILRTIKHSAWLLRVDHFDILMLHEVERDWGVDPVTGDCVIMDVLEDLKKQGVVANIGASSWDNDALAALAATGRIDCILVAGGISLLERKMYEKLMPACKKNDVGIIVGACLGQNTPGLVMKDRAGLDKLRSSKDPQLFILAEKLEKLYDLSDELDLSMVQLAVRYVLSDENIHSHTLGARELAHIQDNIRSVEMGVLSNDVVEEINKIQDIGTTYDFNTIAHAHITDLVKE